MRCASHPRNSKTHVLWAKVFSSPKGSPIVMFPESAFVVHGLDNHDSREDYTSSGPTSKILTGLSTSRNSSR